MIYERDLLIKLLSVLKKYSWP